MSIRQLEFQLLVLRKRIHGVALEIEQAFAEAVIPKTLPKKAEEVRNILKRVRTDTERRLEFSALMDQHHPQAKALMGQCITAATRLFHHAEAAHGAPIGRVSADASLWTRVFNEMINTVYAHPQMYMADGYPLARSLEVIETMLDGLIYAEIPLTFAAVPTAEVLPLTAGNLELARETQCNTRAAPSVVSCASTVSADSQHPRDAPPPQAPMSHLTDADVQSVVSQRRQRAGSPVGSIMTSHPAPGQMSIRVPESLARKVRR